MTAALKEEIQREEQLADKHLEESPIPLGDTPADPIPIDSAPKKARKPKAEKPPTAPELLKFTVNRADLLKELGLASGAVQKKATIPILSHALLTTTSGRVEIRATDLEIAIVTGTPAKVSGFGAVAVPTAKLLAILQATTDDEIRFEAQDTYHVKINAGRAVYKLCGMSSENFPGLPKAPERLCTLPAASLRILIDRTEFSVSSEQSRCYTLNASLLELDGKGRAQMVATDGHRLALHAIEGVDAPEAKLLITKNALAQLGRILRESEEDAAVELSKDDSHLFFVVGDRLLISRTITGTFPNYAAIVPKDHPVKWTADRLALISTLKRVSLMADERSSAVKLTLKPSLLHVEATSAESGESEDDIGVTFDGKDQEPIGFNFKYLLDWLQVVEAETVNVSFLDPASCAAFTVEDGGLYVAMPMRI